jgi:hypothetical protein
VVTALSGLAETDLHDVTHFDFAFSPYMGGGWGGWKAY